MNGMRFYCALILAAACFASDVPYTMKGPAVLLWPDGAPGSEGKTRAERWIEGATPDAFHRVTNIHQPSIHVYLPPKDKATGAAFVVCPGGGDRYLVVDLEGEFVANKLNAMGVAAFVLKSRLEHAEGSTYKREVESLADVQRAIRLVRSRAREWGLDQKRIGVMGFSAGGYLAALAENRFDTGKPQAADPVDRIDCRPDFAVLAYPGSVSAATGAEKDEGGCRNACIPARRPRCRDDGPHVRICQYAGVGLA